MVQLFRFVFFLAGALGGFWASRLIDWSEEIGFPQYLVIILFVILGSAIGYIVGGIVGRETTRAFRRLSERAATLSLPELTLGGVGLVSGLVVALLFSIPLRIVEPQWLAFLATILLFGVCAYMGVQIAFSKREEFSRLFPRFEDGGDVAAERARLKHLDTSAIIDGRFVDLRRMSLIDGRLVVPTFVLAELQTLADSADDVKRERGRRGLDVLDTLSAGPERVEVFRADYPEEHDVDAKLLRLAADTDGTIVTVDYNLTKVARVRELGVLNLNELSDALRPAIKAGDSITVQIVKEGKEPGQGVGYLEDGTMVVVEGAGGRTGEDVETSVSSVFQSSAGRMLFAKPREES